MNNIGIFKEIYDSQFVRGQLEDLGVKPAKSRGQNFLFNEKIIDDIITAADIQPEDGILEIGPGLGALTARLSEKARKVIAIEKDTRLADYLSEKMQSNNKVEIWKEDAVKKIDIASMILSGAGNYKIVANIPYQITGLLLRTILEDKNHPESAVLLVQKEVAERICAKPPQMSIMGVIAQYFSEPKIIRVVKRGNFWPAPKVDSAIIRLRFVRNKDNQTDFFEKIVKIAFASKRKMMKNNLGKYYAPDLLASVFKEAKIGLTDRAEQLNMGQWLKMADRLGVAVLEKG